MSKLGNFCLGIGLLGIGAGCTTIKNCQTNSSYNFKPEQAFGLDAAVFKAKTKSDSLTNELYGDGAAPSPAKKDTLYALLGPVDRFLKNYRESATVCGDSSNGFLVTAHPPRYKGKAAPTDIGISVSKADIKRYTKSDEYQKLIKYRRRMKNQ